MSRDDPDRPQRRVVLGLLVFFIVVAVGKAVVDAVGAGRVPS